MHDQNANGVTPKQLAFRLLAYYVAVSVVLISLALSPGQRQGHPGQKNTS